MSENQSPAVVIRDLLWRRLDQPGYEYCRLARTPAGYSLQGCVLTVIDDQPYRADYVVQCDADWSTRLVDVNTVCTAGGRRLELRRDESGSWWRDDLPLPDFAGITDVDLQISPSTNTLPIRRLELKAGDRSSIDAVWIRFPDLSLEVLPQAYHRLTARRYGYESEGGSFRAELEVDDDGLMVRYGDLWERVAPLS